MLQASAAAKHCRRGTNHTNKVLQSTAWDVSKDSCVSFPVKYACCYLTYDLRELNEQIMKATTKKKEENCFNMLLGWMRVCFETVSSLRFVQQWVIDSFQSRLSIPTCEILWSFTTLVRSLSDVLLPRHIHSARSWLHSRLWLRSALTAQLCLGIINQSVNIWELPHLNPF